MQYHLRFIFIIILFIIAACSPSLSYKEHPRVKQGILDLTTWDFEKDGNVTLNGEWEFYWKHFYTSADFKSENIESEKKYLAVPGYWNDLDVNGRKCGPFGHGTYRLRILLNNHNLDEFAFYIVTMGTSYEFYANGKRLVKVGKIGTTKETSRPQYYPVVVDIKPDGSEIEVLIQASNFSHRVGGLWDEIQFGEEETIRDAKNYQEKYDILTFGCILIIGFYHIGIFLLRRKEKTPLSFGLFCILMALRAVTSNNSKLIAIILPSINWELLVKIDYFTFYVTGQLWILFVYHLFPEEFSKRIIYIFSAINTLYVLSFVVFPVRIYSHFLVYYHIFAVIMMIYTLYVQILSILHKRDGSCIFSAAYMVLFVVLIHDLLYANRIIYSKDLTPSFFILFVFAQAYMLSKRFSNAFIAVENLSDELQQKSRDLEIKNQRLKKIDQLKDEFLANTSHELRTPLNGIIGITESLMAGIAGKLNKRAMTNLKIISSSARRLSNLVNDILDFSKMKRQEIILNRKPIYLRPIVSAVLDLSYTIANSKSIELINNVSDKLYPVDADENRLIQIMHNLVGNAIKFTSSGRVTISAELKDNFYISINITDTGIGIPEDKQELVFMSFEQADGSISRTYGGTGLGLSITKMLVEAHGGSIGVKSIEGKGSTFFFTMPVSKTKVRKVENPVIKPILSQVIADHTDDEDTEEILLGSEKGVQLSSNVLSMLDALVVDDEIVNLQVLVNYLQLRKCKITTATNGRDAIQLIEDRKSANKPFDLILLDVMMPGITGYEVTRCIRKMYSIAEVPVILLTAKTQINDMLEGFESGASDYIGKPFEMVELSSRIDTHVKMAKAHREIKALNAELKALNENLEQKVIQRTAELQESYNELKKVKDQLWAQMKLAKDILDNIEQGLFTVNFDGAVNSEYSAKSNEILGVDDVASLSVYQLLKLNEQKEDSFKTWLELVQKRYNKMKWRKLENLAPIKELELHDSKTGLQKFIRINYQKIFDQAGKLSKLMVLALDETEKRLKEMQIADEKRKHENEMNVILGIANTPPEEIMDFIADTSNRLKSLKTSVDKYLTQSQKEFVDHFDVFQNQKYVLYQDIHTIKGNSGTYDFDLLAHEAHLSEDMLENIFHPNNYSNPDIWKIFVKHLNEMEKYLNEIDDKFNLLYGKDEKAIARIPKKMVEQIIGICYKIPKTAQIPPINELIHACLMLTWKPINSLTRKYQKIVEKVSRRLGKEIQWIVPNGYLMQPEGIFNDIDEALIHLIRNAVVHGIEISNIRRKLAKGIGLIEFYYSIENNCRVIRIVDNGKGIDVDTLVEKAIKKGIISSDDADKMDEKNKWGLIFLDGISTTDEVTEWSGRGVGMNIIRQKIESLKGTIEIESISGKGTVFILRLPQMTES
ncbi:MAG: response regulator [Desulfobacterales bacterium]|nr:response regulator [Desulfobacterales bacterium]